MKRLLLLSGGLDSTLLLARFGADLCVGFDYGQSHAVELTCAAEIAKHYNAPFERHLIPVMPRINDVVFAGRNAVMISVGAAIAQARGLEVVMIGCNFSDAERFPDCRPEFCRHMDAAMNYAYGVRVSAPLLTHTKSMIVRAARDVGVPTTWTCYAPTAYGERCGNCYSCQGLAAAQ
jgi:7-cyano-7-deazaguanine synthase